MSKRIGLWMIATLLVASAAMGTYVYSNGGGFYVKGDDESSSHCPFVKIAKSIVATVTGGTSSCRLQKSANLTAKGVDASAYTISAGNEHSPSADKGELTTLDADQRCRAEKTDTDAESRAVDSATVAQASK